MSTVLKTDEEFNKRKPQILEFGCGNGFQIPYLRQLGNVTASDIYRSEKLPRDCMFVKTDITNSPFGNSEFDVIFSNHVIEHIEDLKSSFTELMRIGKSSCIYTFSVPTNVWLVLSIPAYYFTGIRFLYRKARGRISEDNKCVVDISSENIKTTTKWWYNFRYMLPQGHGVIENWMKCFSAFRVESWEQLFTDNGFHILYTKPLLLYGPSEWPLIPTMNPSEKFTLASSVLFIMKKEP